eukprot:3425413-Pyramimonas_sp.AAC.1
MPPLQEQAFNMCGTEVKPVPTLEGLPTMMPTIRRRVRFNTSQVVGPETDSFVHRLNAKFSIDMRAGDALQVLQTQPGLLPRNWNDIRS